jgi:uncharacterized membrane-anchored protein
MLKSAAVLAIVLALAPQALAQNKTDPAKLEASLHYQQGKIAIIDGAVTLNLPPAYRYLDAQEAEKVRIELWGMLPDPELLGMIVPANIPLQADESWGAMLSYRKHGHIDDSVATTLNADQLLKETKPFYAKGDEKRAREGTKGTKGNSLVRWAEPPQYDKTAHRLAWAEEIAVEDGKENFVNYDLRLLGREGALFIQAPGSISQRDQIRSGMRDVAEFASFNAGHRYADFNGVVDDVASYGVNGLITGETHYVGQTERLWTGLRNFNIWTILAVIGACVYVFFSYRKQFARRRGRP